MNQIEGGCRCGAVRFATDARPDRVGVCHCMDCRKHHGAPFFAAAIFAVGAVRVTGDTLSHEGRHVCRHCGSSVFARTGEEIELHLGALDAPDRFKPGYECWTIRREGWLSPIPGATQHEKDRPSD